MGQTSGGWDSLGTVLHTTKLFRYSKEYTPGCFVLQRHWLATLLLDKSFDKTAYIMYAFTIQLIRREHTKKIQYTSFCIAIDI